MAKIGVYGVHNTTEDMWYIGSSTNIQTRLDAHIKSVKERTGTFSEAHIDSDFEFKILKELKGETQLELWENFYIGKYNSIEDGYNRILASRQPKLSIINRSYVSPDVQIMDDDDLSAFLKLDNKEDIATLRNIVPCIKIGRSFRYDKQTVIDFLLNDSFDKFLLSVGLK